MKRLQAIIAWAVLAAVTAVPAMAQEVPFMGEVVQDDVQARAGAGRRYYVVGDVPRGTRVRVDEVFYGWNKVVPPPGIYSYITKAFVDASGDGKTGTVTADNQDVKAASVQAPGESYRVQTVLNKGDKVQIVGEEGSYYKIIPPDNAYVFLPPGSVQRVQTPVVAAESTAEPEAAQPAAPTPPVAEPGEREPAPKPTPEATTESPAEASAAAESASEPAESPQPAAIELDGEPAAAEATTQAPASQPQEIVPEKGGEPALKVQSSDLAEVEKEVFPLFSQPVLEQPLEEMIAAYEALDPSQMSEQDRRIVALRLRALRDNQRLVETLRNIDRVQREVDEGEVAAQVQAERARVLDPSAYDVTGTLSASAVYSGETLPRLYRIVSGDGLTLAWVLPRQPVDPRQHLGKLVGILGKRQYDNALKQHIYIVERIDVLQPTPRSAAPAEAPTREASESPEPDATETAAESE